MIYTVTFNPSLDYVIQAEALETGKINRAVKQDIYPGGKGNNAAVVLSNLGHRSRVLGFIAGFTGDSLEQMMDEYGCDTEFIKLGEGFTRINVKVHAKEETEINGQGPVITEEAVLVLYKKLERLQKDDILVLAGSIPDTLPEDIYEKIMERLAGKQIRVVVDATKDLLLNVLKYHPFLIKPNHHELGEMFGITLRTEQEMIKYAKKLQEKGARNVLVSMAEDGAVLLTETQEIYKEKPPKGKVLNSVGAGDSMVAGFLAGYLNTGDYEKAFKLGLAAGSATAFQPWLAKKQDIIEALGEQPELYGL